MESLSGPYQCELCQEITQSKQDFVSHIKTKHPEDVDDEVLNTLYSDLKKAQRKMELIQIQSPPAFQCLVSGISCSQGSVES